MRSIVVPCLFFASLADVPPVPPNPMRPTPFFSWNTLPIAFHGANQSGMYTDEALQQLARYSMVTIEKWYTPCGAQGPTQAGPECDVEEKMFQSFRRLKQINPNVTTVMYLNTNFDFAFYRLHAEMMKREAAGKQSYMRDINGTVVSLCNDGNDYCNITTFDHSVQEVNELWTSWILNATRVGGVDGVFADHPYNNPKPVQGKDYAEMCNGIGDGRKCWHYDLDYSARFKEGHEWLLNNTQDLLSKTTGGPVICGPYAKYLKPTDFEGLRKVTAAGKAGKAYIIEASKGACDVAGDESKLAGFLCAMEEYTYLACFHSGATLPKWYAAYDKPLGKPEGPALEESAGSGLWVRRFLGPKGVTIARYNSVTKTGSIQWAGEPPRVNATASAIAV